MKPVVIASGKVRPVAAARLQEVADFRMHTGGGQPPEETWSAWLQEADALFATGNIRVDEALLAKAPKLKVVVQASVGYDNIDIDACTRRGIPVGNTPGVLVDATADLAFGLILCSARLLHVGWAHVKNGAWASASRWDLALTWRTRRSASSAWGGSVRLWRRARRPAG